MKKIIPVLMALLLPAVAPAEMTHQAAIEQRQAAYKETKAEVAAVKDAMKAKDYTTAEKASEVILSNANKLTGLFPEDSYKGDTRAKKKIWKNLADFQERQQQLIAAAEQLRVASQSNDPAELKSAFKALGKNCKGCHRRYRQIF